LLPCETKRDEIVSDTLAATAATPDGQRGARTGARARTGTDAPLLIFVESTSIVNVSRLGARVTSA
jgi:hypothetical protein